MTTTTQTLNKVATASGQWYPVVYWGGKWWWCMLVVCGGGGGVWRGSYLPPILRSENSSPDSREGHRASAVPTCFHASTSEDTPTRPACAPCIGRRHHQLAPRNFAAIRSQEPANQSRRGSAACPFDSEQVRAKLRLTRRNSCRHRQSAGNAS